MNKQILDLQLGCAATAVIIKDNELNELGLNIAVSAKDSSSALHNASVFGRINAMASVHPVVYFVIQKIDEVDENIQNIIASFIKDREIFGNVLFNNVIVVLTVKNMDNIKNLSRELYHYCVVV